MEDRNLFKNYSIIRLLNQLGERELTPFDIMHSLFEQYEKCEHQCQAWESFNREFLKKEFYKEDLRLKDEKTLRVLESIPIGVKDIINTRDFKTQMGSSIWQDFTPGNDARVVFELKQKGGIVAGKTVTSEFAVHALGKTTNPHNALYHPGTSSTGSAVAVSSGMVPAALATQTAGSIIRPASFCGVYGYKPSYGLIPRTGILKTADTLDTVGMFCYHAEDLKYLLDAMRVNGENYPLVQKKFKELECKEKRWRVGIIDFYHDFIPKKNALDKFHDWVEHLKSETKIDVNYIRLPSSLLDSRDCHTTIYHKSLSYYFQREQAFLEKISPIMLDILDDGSKISIEQYKMALKKQNDIASEIDKLFEKNDVIISLSTCGEAPLRTEKEYIDLCYLWTMAYVPTVNVPLFIGENLLPFGAQIVGKKYCDYELLFFLENLIGRGVAPAKSQMISEPEALNFLPII